MKTNNRSNFITTISLFTLFLVYTTALKYIDVAPVGPRGSSVGFSTLNKWVSQTIGVNMFLYNITDWLGIVAILVAFGFSVLGLVQLIKRKSLKLVDKNILTLGFFYFECEKA